ncbi:unnamed protein product [Arctia plantaginis]|uniref:Uncharacterized protein n=1 Tax=Arctia plantaginis TaxID=874455 RepID=A0A8S1B5V6_ARCPL|nr:unnamed protein product [Arctia plantaginis]
MKFKLLVLLAACLVMCVPPAHSRDISRIASSAINTARGIASIVPQMVKAKGSAVAKAAADMASIVTVGAGLKVNALGRAASSIKDAISDGLNAFGEALTKGANTITGDFPSYNEPNPTIRVRPPYAVRCAVDPCNQKIVELKVSPPTYYRYAPSVLKMLRNAAERRYRHGKFLNSRHGIARRLPFAYEIIHTPRVYRGPMGTFLVQKK